MYYLEKAKKEIREEWFKNHKIKSIEGQEGFQRIVWGQEGTAAYQVIYVLSGNRVFVSGDLGDAIYSLTCKATLENIKDFNLSYFTGKLTASEGSKYNFSEQKAKEEIKDYIFDWCDVESVSELDSETRNLYKALKDAVSEAGSSEMFSAMVYHIWQNSNVSRFDSEAASLIAKVGQLLSYRIIAYWVGLQMIIEQLEAQEKKTA